MKLLAFETATEACSVALWLDGEVVERFEVAPRRHAELSLPWADALLAEAGIARKQLDAIALGRGPGAFTGVRLAIAIAQGVALALDRPLLPVSTLAALALQASRPPHASATDGQAAVAGGTDVARVLAAIDARMDEVYTGLFEVRGGDAIALAAEAIVKPAAVTLPGEANDWRGVGTGFGAVGGILPRQLEGRLASVDASALPHAADIARLAAHAFTRGEAIAPELVEPAYLRNNVALTIAEQQALRARK